jgi:hypothetical protein
LWFLRFFRRAKAHFTPRAPRACAEATKISAGVAAAPVTNEEVLCNTRAGVAGIAFIYMAVVFSDSGTLAGLDWGAGRSALGAPGPGGAVGSAAAMGLDASRAKNTLAAAPAAKLMKFLVFDMILLIP